MHNSKYKPIFQKFIILTLLIIIAIINSTTAISKTNESKAEILSRCFFIYAPIYEASLNIDNDRLKSYAIKRMMYMRGVLNSMKTDPIFKETFEKNLPRNKINGTKIEESLIEAYRSENSTRYNSELDKAAVCDRELGLAKDLNSEKTR